MQLTTTFLLQSLKEFSVPIPVFHSMTCLTIAHCEYGLEALPYLLARCESLETLVFEVCYQITEIIIMSI